MSVCATATDFRMAKTAIPGCRSKASAERLVMRANSRSSPTASCTKAPGPVSYTHLDVYKRQELGIASKHLVAIARALSIDARVVIMDEPTAALSHKEINELYELVETLKAQGKAILFISHKFDEIFRIADRYTVFRDGQFLSLIHI